VRGIGAKRKQQASCVTGQRLELELLGGGKRLSEELKRSIGVPRPVA
jgi:hypothetical protein